MLKRSVIWLWISLVLLAGSQYGCAALAGGAVGAAIGHEAADDDDDDD